MARNALEDRLDITLGGVNGWLKFAEAKNGALVTFDTAVLFGLTQVYFEFGSTCVWFNVWTGIVAIQLFAAIVLCLLSFIARTKVPSFLVSRARSSSQLNPLFYGHAAEMQPNVLLNVLGQSVGFVSDGDKLHEDLAQQIVINSKITLQKFALFNAALWVTASALVTPFGAILLYWIFCHETL